MVKCAQEKGNLINIFCIHLILKIEKKLYPELEIYFVMPLSDWLRLRSAE